MCSAGSTVRASEAASGMPRSLLVSSTKPSLDATEAIANALKPGLQQVRHAHTGQNLWGDGVMRVFRAARKHAVKMLVAVRQILRDGRIQIQPALQCQRQRCVSHHRFTQRGGLVDLSARGLA